MSDWKKDLKREEKVKALKEKKMEKKKELEKFEKAMEKIEKSKGKKSNKHDSVTLPQNDEGIIERIETKIKKIR